MAEPMIDAQSVAPLPPPPPPPPPPLPPGRPAGKTRISHPMDDAAPAAFNVFQKRAFTEIMRANHFENAAAAETWIAGMHGQVTDLDCLETLCFQANSDISNGFNGNMAFSRIFALQD